ncbi:3-oxoacyl-ACP synthase III family protein [Legionella cherrii]|uniref:3-oxoacyl-ACP synthase n=1 Tax=Legionella cherrii TaxID=28084 RepID=A0A0W0SCA4_9GAMM|nr:3-oxoacyl-[acyl-carrier-protein] synthase III C-terminal domain-containing protein [Legionella cherrii]KTC80485.1 3-oxoacyl-ACP synthase [Legionella cherrii]VEB39258.1 3-oxoacyl-ACP synthase [Legionella cherrii]
MEILSPNIRFDITAASRVLPNSPPVTNLDILKNFPRTSSHSLSFLEKFAEKIGEEFGFYSRYWCHKPWESLDKSRALTSESLATEAVQKLFAQFTPSKIHAFLLGSTTNKRFTGSQAAAVLGSLGLDAPAYDLKTGCSTSLSTLHLAYALMALGYSNILVSCAETLSKVIDPENEKTWIGLADGAAALFMEKKETGAFTIEKTFFSTEGKYVEAFTTQGVFPPTQEQIDTIGYHLIGDESLMKELAYVKYKQMLAHLLPTEEDREAITWIIPHQVNRKLITHLLEENQIINKSIIWDSDTIGNLGGASVLYSLARAVEEKIFDRPGKILMMSVGGGLSYAAQVLQFHKP